MKIKIRRGTFETNSSSMHSVSILRNETGVITSVEEAIADDDSFNLDESGTLVINDEKDLEFGWGFEILTTLYNKICYVIASTCSYNSENKIVEGLDKVIEAIQRVLPEVKNIVLPITENWRNNELEPTTGYVDHESVGTISSNMSVDELADFMFQQRNILIVDNDNDPHTYQVVSAECTTLEELNTFLDESFDPNLDDYSLAYGEEEEEEEEL